MHYNMADLQEALGKIYKSNCYYSDKSMWGMINKVDVMDGNTAPIEGQGPNV